MPSEEELRIAIKVAQELEHTVYAEQLEKKLKEVITPKEEKEFLRFFRTWIGTSSLYNKSNDKMAEMIFEYLKDNWDFSVVSDPAAPLVKDIPWGSLLYGAWEAVPHNSLMHVMDGSRYIYKGRSDETVAYIRHRNGKNWDAILDMENVNNYRPFIVVKKDLRVDQVSNWYDKNVENK